jgi:ketosteroid isomerase-like protein
MTTTAAANKAQIVHVFAQLETGNPRPFIDALDDEVAWTVVGSTPWSRTYRGKQEVIAHLLRPLRDRLIAPVKVTRRRILADEDCVVVEATGEARTKEGHPYNNTYCWIFRIEGGRVREITEHLDTALVARVLGTPAPANLEQAVAFFGVTDMAASLRFYVDGLGFVMTHSWTPEGKIEWCWLQRGDVALMLQEFRAGRRPEGTLGLGMSVCFVCADAIAYYKELIARGVAARRPFVGNSMWETHVTDPDGYHLYFESPTDAPEETEWKG